MDYKISILRNDKSGTLKFVGNGKEVSCTCYWNLSKKFLPVFIQNVQQQPWPERKTPKDYLGRPFSYQR